MDIFSRRQIIMLRDSLYESVSPEELIDITDLLEVPREWANGNDEDSSSHARLKTLLENLNDNPEKMLELINDLIHRENFWMSEDFVNLVRGAGLDVVGNQKHEKRVVFSTPVTASKKEAIAQVQTAIPKQVGEFLEQAREAFARGDPKTCLGRCRDALESFSRPFALDFIKDLESKAVISTKDKETLGQLWGYLSELGAHANPPNSEQGELGLNLTDAAVIFLTRKLI